MAPLASLPALMRQEPAQAPPSDVASDLIPVTSRAALAGAHEFIAELPEGYDTRLDAF